MAPPDDPPIAGYDDMTVPEVETALADAALTQADLDVLAAYERQHKDRVTALDAIEEAEAAETNAAVVDTDAGPGDDHDTEPAPPAHQVERHRCVVTPAEAGYVAGLYFETADATAVVECGPRVEAAFEAGDLVHLGPDDYRYQAAMAAADAAAEASDE